MQPPAALIRQGVTALPCIGDGRQSGTSGSPSILNAVARGGRRWRPRAASDRGPHPHRPQQAQRRHPAAARRNGATTRRSSPPEAVTPIPQRRRPSRRSIAPRCLSSTRAWSSRARSSSSEWRRSRGCRATTIEAHWASGVAAPGWIDSAAHRRLLGRTERLHRRSRCWRRAVRDGSDGAWESSAPADEQDPQGGRCPVAELLRCRILRASTRQER